MDNIEPMWAFLIGGFLFGALLVNIYLDLRRAKIIRDIQRFMGPKFSYFDIKMSDGSEPSVRYLKWFYAELVKKKENN